MTIKLNYLMRWSKASIKWILNPRQRYCIFAFISCGFAFLYPLVGWNPILLLWIVNAFFAYRETRLSKIRFIHVAIALILAILVLINLLTRILGVSWTIVL